MRIVILTVDHIYSNVVVKAMIKEFKDDISAILVAKIPPPSKASVLQTIAKIFKISGVYYSSVQLVKLYLYRAISFIYTALFSHEDNKFYKFKALAHKNSINLLEISDINSKYIIEDIKKRKPDILVSILFNQILDKNILQIPTNATINIHPGYLPDYKGISPVFWSLVNNEEYAGISVHFVNEGIDSGEIISQEKIRIIPSDTEDSLYWKLIQRGIPLLLSAINQLKNGNITTYENRRGRYFSFPTKEAVRQFRQKNKKLFRLSDYILSK